MNAKIIINDTATSGNFSKTFLFKLYRMGALVTVFVDGEPANMEENFEFIKSIKER